MAYLFVLLLLSSCGKNNLLPALQTGPGVAQCVVKGGTNLMPPNLCIEYTGVKWQYPVASAECDTERAACQQSSAACSALFLDVGNCARTESDAGARVGSCTTATGLPEEMVFRYYAPTSAGAAEAHCAAMTGTFARG